MHLILVNSWYRPPHGNNVVYVVWIEIAYANRSGQSLLADALQNLPALLIPTPDWPMDEVKIHIVQSQPGQTFLECVIFTPYTHICCPQFGSDKQLIARYSGLTDGFSHSCFVIIYRSCIQMPISKFQGI